METNERNPLRWPELFAAMILRIIAAYVRKWSGADSPAELSPEARDEITSRIAFDIMTGGPVPDGITPMHHVFRTCRRWRVRGWAGDTELHRELMRTSRAAERKALRDPGSRESEEARNKDPFRGCSDDARQPRPERILAAVEELERRGLTYVSDRQARRRRKPQRAHMRKPSRFRAVPTGRIVGPNGESVATLFRWEPIPVTEPVGPYDRKRKAWGPYVPYVGTVPNRMIGKCRTPATGPDAVGHAMATMAILGHTPRRRFRPAPAPVAGVPRPDGVINWSPMAPLPKIDAATAAFNREKLARARSAGEPELIRPRHQVARNRIAAEYRRRRRAATR